MGECENGIMGYWENVGMGECGNGIMGEWDNGRMGILVAEVLEATR